MADVSNVVVEGQTYAFNDSNAETKIATLTSNQGSLASLTTTAKGSLVAAINEVKANQGTLTSLTTTAKGTLVAAINEVNALTTGVISISSGSLTRGALTKRGGTVSINVVTAGTALTTNFTTIGNVPAGFRPGTYIFGVGLSEFAPVQVAVLDSGNIQVRAQTAAASASVQFCMSWNV